MKHSVKFRLTLVTLAAILAVFSPITKAATITVNSTNDPAGFNSAITIGTLGATVTLRDAMNAAVNTGGANTITFAPSLAGSTIGLVQGTAPSVPAAFGLSITIQGLNGNRGITIARSSTNQFRLFLVYGSLTLNNLTISNGAAGGGYGGAVQSYGALRIAGCTFINNSASAGGAIHAANVTVDIVNSTFTGNTAQSGGVIYIDYPVVSVTNCTFAGNGASINGGCFYGLTRSPIVVNSILAGNFGSFPNVVGSFDGASKNNLFDHSAVSGGGAAGNGAGNLVNGVNGNILGVNPLLKSLANNGGPTMTMALSNNSPAINAGFYYGVAADQRGIVRPPTPSLGAYEFFPAAYAPDGAIWYFNTNAVGADWQIYRQATNQSATLVDGLATQIGVANDGSVVVENASGGVYSRIGSTNSVGSGWQLIRSVTAGDGATWFVGPDAGLGSLNIYRWEQNSLPEYSIGAGTNLVALYDGSILTRANNNSTWRRIGSNAGIGSFWQQVFIPNTAPVLKNPTYQINNTVQFSFTNQPGLTLTVLATTNLTLPLAQWTVLGAPLETFPGNYQFTDPATKNSPPRFYRVISP